MDGSDNDTQLTESPAETSPPQDAGTESDPGTRGIVVSGSSDGGSKPFDDPPRDKANAAHTHIYALLVGINEYVSPANVRKLKGCIKDVENMEAYLRRKYPAERLHLRVLKDEQATYTAIVDGFENHLSQATGNDSVFFHFSGHGAQQFTADAFFARRADKDGNLTLPPMVPGGKDQTLVCYQAPDSDDNLFLADKELAKLIQKVYTNPRTSENNRPHIVISLDSCHSGGGTREGEEDANAPGTRYFETAAIGDPAQATRGMGPGEKRDLSSYYGGYTPENLEIPTATHVLLSASLSHEEAGDIPSMGGVFSISLVNALNEALDAGTTLDYNRLFNMVRRKSVNLQKELNLANKQSPQIENLDGFNPYTAFLEGWPAGQPGQYELYTRNARWFINCGAVHGLPMEINNPIKVVIYPTHQAHDPNKPLFYGHVTVVGAQHSLVALRDANGNAAPATLLDTTGNTSYTAVVAALPAAPMFVTLHGNDTATLAKLIEPTKWEALNAKNIFHGNANDPLQVSIEVNTDAITLQDLSTVNDPFVRYNLNDLDADFVVEKILTHDLEKIAAWRRMIDLEHPKSRISHLFKAEMLIRDNDKNVLRFEPGAIKVHTDDRFKKVNNDPFAESFDDFWYDYNFEVDMKKVPQDLYFYLFILRPNAQIEWINDGVKEVKWDPENVDRSISMFLMRDPVWKNVGMLTSEQEFTFWYKLFATTEPMDPHLLEQHGISSTRPVESEAREDEKIKHAWAVQTFQYTFTREPAPVTADRPTDRPVG